MVLPIPAEARTASDPDFGVYLHIPFCVSKCAYCAFSSGPASRGLVSAYQDAVHCEIDAHAHGGAYAGRTARTLYFGGGTPSLAAPSEIAGLIDHCRQAFALASDAEITLEANPETVSYDRLRGFLDAGVTRISLGVQSFDPRELTVLRRAHSSERVARAWEAARRAGCANLSLDLIYGIPDQTPETWTATVDAALALEPDHLSAYALTPEAGTAFGLAVEEGRAALPSDDEVDTLEAVLHDRLDAAGFYRYEISNYARPGRACRHNLLYWSGDDWLGLGASAHSHVDGRRWWNHFDADDYVREGEDGRWTAGREQLTPERCLAEALAFGIRMIGGIDGDRLRARFAVDPWERYAQPLDRLIAMGLVEPRRPLIRLTPRGLDLADMIAAEFLST
jgi:oxygen-independent coproporphyrinogen-3 oxidase